ncbi:MAG: rod shape-determining protein RodA [Deltaproteobacteria bacterium]|nr:rod shape-determining protein RodA [Deltaproteobacteria bacterium]MBW2307234.1 rod shape-determining protein RodA [Deltaproteobacteria bacterium]
MIGRRLLQNIDWTLLLLCTAVAAIGIMNLYSASRSLLNADQTPYYLKQLYWFIIGLVILTLIAAVDYHILDTVAYPLYGFSIILLLLVISFGQEISGSRRWLRIMGFSIQPSEIIKLTIIFALARYFQYHDQIEPYTLRNLYVPLALIAVPVVLIIIQPDLGTSLLILFIAFTVTLFMKVHPVSILILAGISMTLAPVFWYNLKDYQKKRVMTFLDPSLDPLGSGYHIIQSKIAVGSGGLLGKGFMKGTQTRLHFLPEQHTDFALSVLAEEWGFIGSLVVLVLLLFIILKGISIAYYSRDRLGALVAIGVSSMIFWQTIVNAGMVVGLLPVVGAPMPFISYGGSSYVCVMAGIGLLINIRMRRFRF